MQTLDIKKITIKAGFSIDKDLEGKDYEVFEVIVFYRDLFYTLKEDLQILKLSFEDEYKEGIYSMAFYEHCLGRCFWDAMCKFKDYLKDKGVII